MAHELDFTLSRPAIAYAGEAPWHKLGNRLNPDDSIETWTREAGLGWIAKEHPIFYRSDVSFQNVRIPGYKALIRDDANTALSIVSEGYNVVQPAEVMAFFGELIKAGGFAMESAGALLGGRRIWALARVHDGAPIVAGDTVKPYVLLATSYDGTLATTARLTGVRVVCQNTLNLSEYAQSGRSLRVTHDRKFDAREARLELGIYADGFERWLISAKRMADREIDLSLASSLTAELISHTVPRDTTVEDIKETAGYKRIMELFDGAAIGGDLAGPTVWGWLNAVTQHIDHERGRLGTERRFASAMLGAGDRLKNIAHARAAELI